MILKRKVEITRELLDEQVPEEEFYRELAHGIIKDMTIDQLKYVFSISKVDPCSPQSVKDISNPDIPDYWKDMLRHLLSRDTVQFRAHFIIEK